MSSTTYWAMWSRWGERVHATETFGTGVTSLCGKHGNAPMKKRTYKDMDGVPWCKVCQGVIDYRADPKWCASCKCNGEHPCTCANGCISHRPQGVAS